MYACLPLPSFRGMLIRVDNYSVVQEPLVDELRTKLEAFELQNSILNTELVSLATQRRLEQEEQDEQLLQM